MTDDVVDAPARLGRRPYAVPTHPAPIDLRLDANEGPPSPREVVESLARLDPEKLRRYPSANELEIELATRHGVAPERVVVTAGADGAIDRVCRAFLGPNRAIILPVPTFEMIARYADVAGASTVKIDWPGGPFPTEQVLAAVGPDTAVIAVVSPNNPTGAVGSARDLLRLSEACPQSLILLDAAYGEFADEDLTSTGLGLPNVIVTRSLSKAWGLAGVRVGCAIAPARLAPRVRAAGGPYDVSGPAIAIALARLRCGSADIDDYVGRVRVERRHLDARVREMGGEPTSSQANFVLARFRNATWVRDALAGLGIGVRVFPGQPALASHVRITCPGDERSFTRLGEALSAALRPEALLFDLDGVLADVSQSYRRAILETAGFFGVSLTGDDVSQAKTCPGSNNDWMVTQRLITARGVEVSLGEVIRRFESIYQGEDGQPGLWKAERLIPNAALLERLRRRMRLGVVTGRPRSDAERFLRHAGVAELFDTVTCMEDAPLKPDPAPIALALRRLGVKCAWMVGDTADDIRAARAAGVVPLGIVGPSDEPTAASTALSAAGAGRILGSLAELEELLP